MSALLLTAAMTAAACTTTEAPTPAATSAATASPTPTPTPSPTPEGPQPPARPSATESNDEAGALALAQYFVVDLYTYAFSTGDVEAWQSLSDPGCSFCTSVVQNAAAMQERGEKSLGEPATVESATVATITEGSRYTATLTLVQRTAAPEPTDGGEPGEPGSQRYQLLVAVAWEDGWRIQAVDVRPEGA